MCLQLLYFQYDLSASQFSPDGRVFQVEYAQKAVENSGYVILVHFTFLHLSNIIYKKPLIWVTAKENW